MPKKKAPPQNASRSRSHGGESSSSRTPVWAPPRDRTANSFALLAEAVHEPAVDAAPVEVDSHEGFQRSVRRRQPDVPAYYTSDQRFNAQVNALFTRLRVAADDNTSVAIMGEIDRMINPEPSNWTDSLDEPYPEDGQLAAGPTVGSRVQGHASSAAAGGNSSAEVSSSWQSAVRIPIIAPAPMLALGVGRHGLSGSAAGSSSELRIRRQSVVRIALPLVRNGVWGDSQTDVQQRMVDDTGPAVPQRSAVPPTPPARRVEDPYTTSIRIPREEPYFNPPARRERVVRPPRYDSAEQGPEQINIRHVQRSRAARRIYPSLVRLSDLESPDTSPDPVPPSPPSPPAVPSRPPSPPAVPSPPSPPPPPPATSPLSQHALNKLAEDASLLLELYTHPAADHTATAAADLIASAFESISTLHQHHRLPTVRASDFTLDAACIVCYAEFADTVLLPCAHLVLCSACCDTMGVKREMQQAWIAAVRCPVCRAEVKDRVKVFR